MESCIKGFHKEVWAPFIRERLGCARERSNREDPFSVAMKRDTETVGHVSHTISCVCMLYMFAGSKNNDSGTKQLAKRGVAPLTSYRHLSYT